MTETAELARSFSGHGSLIKDPPPVLATAFPHVGGGHSSTDQETSTTTVNADLGILAQAKRHFVNFLLLNKKMLRKNELVWTWGAKRDKIPKRYL